MSTSRATSARPAWPILLLALPAAVAIWSGWVGLGGLTGFGIVQPLPGIWDGARLNTAITLPIGVEAYAAYAMWVAFSEVHSRAHRFAIWSSGGSIGIGALGQIAYHLMVARGVTAAPWPITTAVSCLPVVVLGMGVILAHLVRMDHLDAEPAQTTGIDQRVVDQGVDRTVDHADPPLDQAGPDQVDRADRGPDRPVDQQMDRSELSPAARAVLEAVRDGQPIGKAAIMERAGIKSRTTATRAVGELIAVELLRTIGDKRSPSYVLAEAPAEVAP